jgi:NADH-quinone oxidoreductase subunit E
MRAGGTISGADRMNSQISEAEIVRVVEQAIINHGASCEALVPILSEINRVFGFVPTEAIPEIRRRLQNPGDGMFLADSHLFSIASFYQMLSLRQLGTHDIRFCVSAPCHVMGGRLVLKAIQDELGIKLGETTADKKWSLLETSCLGLCGVGPVCIIDGNLHGNLTPEKVPEILARYRESS